MKVWKALGLTALAVGLAPYRLEKDDEHRTTLYESLLMRVHTKRRSPEEVEGTDLSNLDVNVQLIPMITDNWHTEHGFDFDGDDDVFGDKAAEPTVNRPVKAAVDGAVERVKEVLTFDEPVMEVVKDRVDSAVERVKDALENQGETHE